MWGDNISIFNGKPGIHPKHVIITDDPLRAKMLAAHHLEYARPVHDSDDELVWFGSYAQTEIALASAGFSSGAVADYISSAAQYGVTDILFIGECTSASDTVPLRTVVLADGADSALMRNAQLAAAQFNIPYVVQIVSEFNRTPQDIRGTADAITDAFYATPMVSGIADTTTNAFYAKATDSGIAALAILTVTHHTGTGERMEDHERRSRLYNAARLAFETCALL